MIYLIEPCKDPIGHSIIYLNSLLKIKGTYHLEKDVDLTVIRGHKWLMVFKYYIALRKQLKAVPKGNVTHLLYADIYYKIPFVCSRLLHRNKTIATMHSFPKGKLKNWLMKNFCKRVERVIVHSEYIQKQMNAIGIHNVSYVDYPSFYDYSQLSPKDELRAKYGIKPDDIVLTALGTIRQDKGLDILLEAFRYCKLSVKNKILLNVAGKTYDTFLQESDIRAVCDKHGIRSHLTIRPLSEEEFMENVRISDYLVMPYRKNMTGNSGPMTEAIVNHIPSIVPEQSNLGAIAKSYNVGICFDQEDAKSLAKTIERVIEEPRSLDFTYAEKLHERCFIKTCMELYQKIMNTDKEERN